MKFSFRCVDNFMFKIGDIVTDRVINSGYQYKVSRTREKANDRDYLDVIIVKKPSRDNFSVIGQCLYEVQTNCLKLVIPVHKGHPLTKIFK